MTNREAFGLAEYAVLKGEVHIGERHIEWIIDVLSGKVVCCVLDSVDSVANGSLDRLHGYGSV